MGQWFGEAYHRARRGHRCDYCGEYILPGQRYYRALWKPQPRGRLEVMREHSSPACPREDGEWAMQQEVVALGIPIAMELKLEKVLAVLRDGTVVEETKTVVVSTIAPAIPITHCLDDEDIPF